MTYDDDKNKGFFKRLSESELEDRPEHTEYETDDEIESYWANFHDHNEEELNFDR